MSYDAGTAFLQVVPSLAGVVDAITEEFSKDGEIAGEAFKETFQNATRGLSATVGLETRPADERLAELKAEIDSVRESISVDVKDTAALAKIQILKAELDSLRGSIDLHVATGLASDLKTLEVAANDASGAGGGGGGLFGLASSVGSVGADIGGTAPALGILATALVPIAGLAAGALTTLPAIFAGMASGVGALYIGVQGILPAITAYQATLNTTGKTAAQVKTEHNNLANAMAGLTPAGQTFVAFVATQLLPIFSGLKNAVQGALLPGIANGLQSMLPFFQALIPFITQAASGIGTLFAKFGAFLGSAKGLSETNAIFSAGAGFMQQLGNAALTLFQAIGSIGSQAGPILKQIGDGIVNMVNGFARWAEGKGFQDFLAWVKANGPGIVSDLEEVVKTVVKFVIALAPIGKTVLDLIGGVAKLAGTLIGPFKLALAAANLSLTGWKLIIENLQKVVDFFATHWQQIWDDIKRWAYDAYAAVKSAVLDPLVAFFTQTIPHAFDVFTGAFVSAWNAVQGAAVTVWQFIDGNVFQPIANFFTVTLPGAITTAVGFFTSIPGRIGGALSSVFTTITGAFGDVADWVKQNIIDPTVAFFSKVPGDIYNAISSGVKGAADIATKIINGVIGLLNDVIHFYDSHRPSLFGVSLLPFVPDIPTLHDGGIVPGPPGANVPTIMQAGELVISRPDLAGLRSAAPAAADSRPNVNMPINVVAYDPRTAAVQTFTRAGFALKTRGF